jgi:hypothetical protein
MRRRAAPAQAKELAEQAYQLRQWRAWHRTLAAEALAGPHGALVRQIFEILRTMSLHDARLIDLARATNWDAVDQQTKYVLLHEIDRRITALREQVGLPPFSDALPHQQLNGFLVIKELMTGTCPERAGK